MTTTAEINASIRYANWSVFRMRSPLEDAHRAQDEFDSWVRKVESHGGTLRGVYDVRGFRGDASLLLWTHAPAADDIQESLREFSRSSWGRCMEPTWSGMGVHRPAEFNRDHVPGFLTGPPRRWACVYPFVRSYDWYLLPEAERRALLGEHGRAGAEFPNITSSTVASFALGDYEWLLALEADEPHEIVDLMRHLRNTRARLFVREEVPFFTGSRVPVTEVAERFS